MILPAQISPPLDCLIIDSDDQDAQILSEILGGQGYQIRRALNGSGALEYLQIKIPDLIFWDCSEAEDQCLNFDFFYKYFGDHKHNITIFFLILCYNSSCTIPLEYDWHCDYIRKPFNSQEIMLRIKNIQNYRQNQKVLSESLLNLQQEISARKAAESKLEEISQKLQTTTDKLKYLSRLDPLTQLANRPYFDEYLLREWQRLARERIYLSLIIADVDRFQGYNEVYGYDQGDICLQRVAQALQQGVQRSIDLVARYGGEEFVVILPYTDTYGALQVADNIQDVLQQFNLPHRGSTIAERVTISIGVCTIIPTTERFPLDLINRADNALYQAKTQGRNRAVSSIID